MRLGSGARIRVRAPGVVKGRLSGTLLRITEEMLVVESGDRDSVGIPRDAITELDVSVGRRSRARKGALIGAGVGAAGGAVMLAGLCSAWPSGDDCSAGLSLGFVVASAAGVAAWGALIGHLKKADDWRPVRSESLQLAVAPVRGRGIGVTVSVSS